MEPLTRLRFAGCSPHRASSCSSIGRGSGRVAESHHWCVEQPLMDTIDVNLSEGWMSMRPASSGFRRYWRSTLLLMLRDLERELLRTRKSHCWRLPHS